MACGAVLAALASDAHARNWTVNVGGSQLAFSPKSITIAPGDTITWRNLGGYHNVVADDGAFRCAHGCDGDGHGGNGALSATIWTATRTFTTGGSFGYFCEAHGMPGQGMFGTIIVQATPVAVPIPPPVPWAGPLGFLALVGAIAGAAGARLRKRPPA